jgi:hypothetical protein
VRQELKQGELQGVRNGMRWWSSNVYVAEKTESRVRSDLVEFMRTILRAGHMTVLVSSIFFQGVVYLMTPSL